MGYEGRFYRFEPIDPAPFPAQARLPILIGGHSPVAFQRVVRAGDGWISTQLPVETQRESMDLARYERLGFEWVIVGVPSFSEDHFLGALDHIAGVAQPWLAQN